MTVLQYFGPEASPYRTSIANGNFQHLIKNLLLVHRLLNPPLQETSKVPFDGGIDKEAVATNPLVCHDPENVIVG
jgi:hypothetical protein